MNAWINALTLKFEGDADGTNKPTGTQIAIVWGGLSFMLGRAL